MSNSQPNSTDSHAVVGVILGAHGVNGELRVRSLSDVPHRFDPGQKLYLRGREHLILSSSKSRSGPLIVRLDGINTQPEARTLTGEELTSRAASAPALPEGEYFHFQLIGLQVFTEEGEPLGAVEEIIATGSNDVYVVKGPGGEVLIPALEQVVRQVDIPGNTMTVRLMEGLR